jgi:hypothetical protein
MLLEALLPGVSGYTQSKLLLLQCTTGQRTKEIRVLLHGADSPSVARRQENSPSEG